MYVVDFMVVNKQSAYNAIIWTSILNAIKAMVSIYHLAMKFPVDCSVEVIKGDQTSIWEYYTLATKSNQKAKAISIVYQIDNLDLLAREVTKMLSELDPCDNGERKAGPVEDLEEVALDLSQPEKVVQIGTGLPK